MDKKILIGTIIFNLSETILILLVGMWLHIPIRNILIIMLTFMISRGCFGKALHFKTWYRCLVWSLLILFSLFVLLKVDLVVSILATIFSALIMTKKADIQDTYLWNNDTKISKYRDIEEYFNVAKKTKKFKRILKEIEKNNSTHKEIFVDRFVENLSFKQIGNKHNIASQRITAILDDVCNSIRIAKNL